MNTEAPLEKKQQQDEIYRDTMSGSPASLDSVIMNIVGTDGPQISSANSVVDFAGVIDAPAAQPPIDLSGAEAV